MAYYKDITPSIRDGELVGYGSDEDLDAIKNSLKNLFLIREGEVPGKPHIGSPVGLFVFDNIGYFEERTIETAFANTVELFEPRVTVSSLSIETAPEYNTVTVYLEYFVTFRERTEFQTTRFSLAHNEMTSIRTRNSKGA